jgi:tellurite resistance protein TerC
MDTMHTLINSVFGEFSPWLVVGFFGVVLVCLFVDLKAHDKDKPISIKNAAVWSAVWIGLAVAFGGYIGLKYGQEKASLFLAGYFLEKSLSVDNLFVIMAIFASFAIKDAYQHRTLYWGILGALVLRMLFISFGTTLAALSEWVLVGFGVFVLWTAYKMALVNEAEDEIEDYSNHFAVRWTQKLVPVHPKLVGHSFFTKQGAKLYATPLLLALVCVEFSDIAFAFDSVPAVIAVTREPVLVYTSNIFAILGLRSLYFLLVAAKKYLVHLEKAVVGILVFIGLKMITGVFGWIHISANISLLVVLGGLLLGIAASVVFPEKKSGNEEAKDPASPPVAAAK